MSRGERLPARQRTELDLLRVVAAIGVIVAHVEPPALHVPLTAWDQAMHHVFPAAVTWSVPCFIMISGRFLLDPARPLPPQKLFGKYLLRLLITFAFWSPLYLLYDMFMQGFRYSLRDFISLSLTGYYHMWYIFMMAGLYLVAPVMRRIASDRRTTEYFLALFLIMAFFTEYGRYLPGVGWSISNALTYGHIDLVMGFTGFFLMGLYLHEKEIGPRAERLIYLAGALCFVFTVAAGLWLRAPEGEEQTFFQLFRKPNVVIASGAIYLFFDRRVSRLRFAPLPASFLSGCAKLGLGVYMAHVMVYETLLHFGLHPHGMSPAATWLLFVPEIYLLSLALAWLLRRIPWLGKYIV